MSAVILNERRGSPEKQRSKLHQKTANSNTVLLLATLNTHYLATPWFGLRPHGSEAYEHIGDSFLQNLRDIREIRDHQNNQIHPNQSRDRLH